MHVLVHCRSVSATICHPLLSDLHQICQNIALQFRTKQKTFPFFLFRWLLTKNRLVKGNGNSQKTTLLGSGNASIRILMHLINRFVTNLKKVYRFDFTMQINFKTVFKMLSNLIDLGHVSISIQFQDSSSLNNKDFRNEVTSSVYERNYAYESNEGWLKIYLHAFSRPSNCRSCCAPNLFDVHSEYLSH